MLQTGQVLDREFGCVSNDGIRSLTCSARSHPQPAQIYFGRSIQMSDSCCFSDASTPAIGDEGGLRRSAMLSQGGN